MAEEKEKKTEKKLDWKQSIVMYLHDFIYMLMILMVFLLLFRVIRVSGDSMYPTLWDGDYILLLSNLTYQEPKQGDIVVVNKGSYDTIVKRVIATEGQTVDIDFQQGIVYVDGVAMDEPYINDLTTRSGDVSFPLTVHEGYLFVLGDNRGVSLDSRYHEIGQIDRREVLGKAVCLMIPGTDGVYARPRDYSRMGAVE